jgi:hypothetical protein
MLDASFPEDEWTPIEGFDGLPIPGLPPSAQPGMQRSQPAVQPAPLMLPAHGGQRPLERPAVERSAHNYSVEPAAIAQTEPYFGPSLGADPAPAVPVVTENGHSLGLALLLVTVGTGVGLKLGGTMGGVSGGLFGGAAVNAIRAARCVTKGTPEADKEALVSGTWALIAAGLGGFLTYKEQQGKKGKPTKAHANRNAEAEGEDGPDDDPDEPEEEEQEPEEETDEDEK